MKRIMILLILLAVAAVCLSDYSSMGPIEFITDSMRSDGEGVYIFTDGADTGMATPGDTEGVKLYFDYGVTPTVTGSGKMCHGLDIKYIMDQPWDFTSADRNAVIRGARIQGISQNNVGGRVFGIYSNARSEGTYGILGTFATGATSAGLISIEARTEVMGTSATLTTPRVVGLLCYHRNATTAILSGEYAAIQIDEPLHGTSGITGDRFGILFTDDHQTAANCYYDYAFGFEDNLDADAVAHYSANMTTTAVGTTTVDGWIAVKIDDNVCYIWLWAEKPS